MRITVAVLAGLLSGCAGDPFAAVASRYVALALASDAGDDVAEPAAELLAEIETLPPSDRREFLISQLRALAAPVPMRTFDEESSVVYGTVVPRLDASALASTRLALDRLLPGDGSLVERYRTFSRKHVVPSDRIEEVIESALSEARKRTSAHLVLPSHESIELAYVTGKPWASFHYYLGDAKSRVEINLDFPMTLANVLDVVCHETYPGHHAIALLLDDANRPELSVQPIRGPLAVEVEGLASYGVGLAFPGDDRLAFERDVLFPLAGLDPSDAERMREVEDLVATFAPLTVQGARAYLDGDRDRVQTAIWLEEQALVPDPWSYLRFVDRYRTYVVAYTLGASRAQERLGSATDPWKVFANLDHAI